MSVTADNVLYAGKKAQAGLAFDGNCNDLRNPAFPTNWPLLFLLFLLPLQNIQFGYLPVLPGGLNFLNIFFLLSWMVASRIGGTLSDIKGINAWLSAHIAWGALCVLVGYTNVEGDSDKHFNAYKDQAIGIAIFFIVQMSVRDWTSLRRIALVTLLPLAYIARVVWVQHRSVSSWHYDDDLRISGTFLFLGANEMAAFAVTVVALCLALLFVIRQDRVWTPVLIIGLLSAAACITYGYSRTSYVAVGIVLLAVFLCNPKRAKWFVPFVLALVVTTAVVPQSVRDRFSSLTVSGEEADGSTQSRFVMWDIAFERWKSNPALGIGYHAFHHRENNPLGKDTHNYYVLMLVERGLIGAVIFLVLIWKIWAGVRSVHKIPDLPLWGRAVTLAVIGATLGVYVGCTFGDRFSHYPMIGIFWAWLALALKVPDLLQADSEKPGEADRSRALTV